MIKDYLDVKGSWRQRLFIYSMTFLLTLLFIWVLGFVIDDLGSMKKPEWSQFEKTYLSSSLVTQQKNLKEEIDQKNIAINQVIQQRTQLTESTKNAQTSIKELNEQQKLLLQNGKALSDKEMQFKTNNMELFQSNQAKDQKLAQTLITLTADQQTLSNELKKTDSLLEKQREPARKDYDKAFTREALFEAVIQILFLLAVIVLAALLFRRYQKTTYRLPLLAFFIAAIYKMIMVLHDYFPSEYFKYILILALIVIIAKILMLLIRNASSSEPQVLLKRFRDAYVYFQCPGCEFPIRRGPMKYLFWTRRTLPKLILREGGKSVSEESAKEEAYTCPVCSTELFSTCDQCKKIRYALLPACPHCGSSGASQ